MKSEPIKTKPEYTADAIDLRSAIEAFAEGERRAMSVCFPACVRSYDRKTHTAEVLPLLKEGYFTGKWEYKTKDTYTVTVRAIQIGGFTIDIPLYVGDTGWVIASDRDTVLLKQDDALTTAVLEDDRSQILLDASYPQKPHQPILHDFSRGFFIPDNWGIWDFEKFKDSDKVKLDDALYIGTSIDTVDKYNPDATDTEDDVGDIAKDLQTESKYEEKSTSSIVIERDGGINLLSSAPKKERRNARLSLKGSFLETEVIDEENKRNTYSAAGIIKDGGDEKVGFVVRQRDKNNEVKYEYSKGELSIESICGQNDNVKITIKDGKLRIETTNKVNVRTRGTMRVNTRGDVSAEANSATISASGASSLISNGGCQVYSSKSVNVQGASQVYIGSMKELSLTASKNMNISGHTIRLDSIKDMTNTAQHFQFTSDGGKGVGGFKVTTRDFSLTVGASEISLMNNEMSIRTQSLTLSSSENSVSMSANEKATMSGCTPTISGFTQGTANGTSAWVY